MFLSGYGHFLRRAAAIQWDEAAIDLRPDAAAWPGLEADRRAALLALLAGFCVGEASVASELEPFAAAAPGGELAACFRAQAVDEARHARFFDRVAREVAGVPGAGAAQRRAWLREALEPGFVELFERRLPAVARRLGRGDEGLDGAVGLYHLLLEGVVFTAGQLALLELLAGAPALAGLRRGVELVLDDERWHIGFGARCLDELGRGSRAPDAYRHRGEDPGLDRVLAEGEAAVAAWGDVVGEGIARRVLSLHRRRLAAAGLRTAGAAA